MADPGYDFFATGAPAGTAEAAPATPATNRFGGPADAEAAPPAGVPVAVAPVLPPPAPVAPALEPAATGVPGYHPGNVNRFGTPAELAAVPTGPYAAPGLGAAPIESPGLVSTWAGPVAGAAPAAPPSAPAPVAPVPAPASPTPLVAAPAAPSPAYPAPVADLAAPPAPVAVSRFGSPIPPDVLVEDPSYAALAFGTPAAAAAFGAPGHGAPAVRAHRGAGPDTPAAVTAAGIVGIVQGVLALGLALIGWLGYLAVKSQLDELTTSPQLSGSGLTVSTVTNLVLVALVILALFGVGYLAAGIAVVRGQRWGAWTLLVVSMLSALYGVYSMATGASNLGTLISVAVSVAVVVLLGRPASMAWLRRS